jgi:hypothetical protein
VVESVPSIVEIADRTARRHSLATPSNAVDIVTAGLGDNSGIVGAALLNAE